MAYPLLLVHADELVVHRFQEALRDEPYEVTVASDGVDGLSLVDRISPALVVSDIMLPKVDGITLLQALRTREDTRGMPLIFLSGVVDPVVMMRGLAAGARYYVTVPFQEEDLRYKLRRLVMGREGP